MQYGERSETLLEYLSFEKIPQVNYAKFLEHNLLSDKLNAALKKKVGIVSSDLVLLKNKTISENLQFYQSAVGVKNVMNETLNELGLLASKRVSSYDLYKQTLIQIAVALAKKPELLVINNPNNQLKIDEYTYMMNKLQSIASRSGVGVLVILSNIDLVNLFPGRSF